MRRQSPVRSACDRIRREKGGLSAALFVFPVCFSEWLRADGASAL
jgi:hypothetical protein